MTTILMQSEFMFEADAVEFTLDFIVHEGRVVRDSCLGMGGGIRESDAVWLW